MEDDETVENMEIALETRVMEIRARYGKHPNECAMEMVMDDITEMEGY